MFLSLDKIKKLKNSPRRRNKIENSIQTFASPKLPH